MSVTVIMLIAIAILILVIVSGPPIPLAFAGAIIWLVFALEVDSRILFTTAYGNVKAFILVALPLFILAGGVMAGGHIGDVLVVDRMLHREDQRRSDRCVGLRKRFVWLCLRQRNGNVNLHRFNPRA